MIEPIVFAIDGAQTMRDIEKPVGTPYADDAIRIPEMDHSYRFGAVMGDFLLASRDGYEFVLAITVEYGGKKATRDDMVKALWN